MAKIQLEVSDKQLSEFKESVEKMIGGEVTDPLLLLTILLQQECDKTSVYVDVVFDGGGNSIGDVLEEGSWDCCYIEDEDDEY